MAKRRRVRAGKLLTDLKGAFIRHLNTVVQFLLYHIVHIKVCMLAHRFCVTKKGCMGQGEVGGIHPEEGGHDVTL